MMKRLFNACLLRPGQLEPSRPDFEVVGAFNPGAIDLGEEVLLMVRVAERPRERRAGLTALPRWEPGGGPVVDWLPDVEVEPLDPRVVMLKRDASLRLTSVSHIRIFRSKDGRCIESLEGSRLDPAAEYEQYGLEDPRIVCFDGRFAVTYVAVSRHGAGTALAVTNDFERFERKGPIFCPENKDVVLFPERIAGEYVALHRPNPNMHFSAPEIWLARSPDLVHWGRHEPLHAGAESWEAGRIGAGPPPLKTDAGWLLIYHGKTVAAAAEGPVGTYSAGCLLLDLAEPARIVRRARAPILLPRTDFERHGFVPGVVFPTGAVVRGDRLLLYYGAADTCTGLVELSLREVLASLS